MVSPMRILVRLGQNRKFFEIISRFCATLSAIGCTCLLHCLMYVFPILAHKICKYVPFTLSYMYISDRHTYKYVPLRYICLDYISDRHMYIVCVRLHGICQYVTHSILYVSYIYICLTWKYRTDTYISTCLLYRYVLHIYIR